MDKQWQEREQEEQFRDYHRSPARDAGALEQGTRNRSSELLGSAFILVIRLTGSADCYMWAGKDSQERKLCLSDWKDGVAIYRGGGRPEEGQVLEGRFKSSVLEISGLRC